MRNLKPGVNDLATLYPDIAKDWDYEKNMYLPTEVTAYCHYQAYWVCGKCGYHWQVAVNTRSKGNGCPACGGQVVIEGKNDLLSRFPQIAEEWDYEISQPQTPNCVSYGSTKKYSWKCKKCGGRYLASVNQRTNANSGCPYCTNHKVFSGFNDLETLYPEVAKEWDYEANGVLLPSHILPHYRKLVYWHCSECDSVYTAYPSNKIRGDKCPICSGHQVKKGVNDLATIYPSLVLEWDSEKNSPLSPEEITAGSNKSVWWKCSICGHNWSAPIVRRANGSQCPKCNHRNHTSFPEQTVLFYIKKKFSDAVSGYTEPFSKSMELDIFIPSLRIGIEYDGDAWHDKKVVSGIEDREKKKYETCKRNGIKLIRIREGGSVSCNCDIMIPCNYKNKKDFSELDITVHMLFNELNSNPPKIDTKNDAVNINEQFLSRLRSSSFGELFPQYIEEWNTERNGSLTPYMFLPKSNDVVWWKCKTCGYQYKMSISDKSSGHQCLKCSYKKRGEKLKHRFGKRVQNIDTGDVFDTISDAASYYGMSSGNHISECCRGLRPTAHGYHWKFI